MSPGKNKKFAARERDIRYRIVGKFLRDSRRKASLTQGAVARSLSYSTPQFISNWERGFSLPPLDALPKLCRLYNLAPRTVLEVVHRYQSEMLALEKEQLAAVLKVE